MPISYSQLCHFQRYKYRYGRAVTFCLSCVWTDRFLFLTRQRQSKNSNEFFSSNRCSPSNRSIAHWWCKIFNVTSWNRFELQYIHLHIYRNFFSKHLFFAIDETAFCSSSLWFSLSSSIPLSDKRTSRMYGSLRMSKYWFA